MEPYIPISFLNDFIFCPRSIYFHQLYGRTDTRYYQAKAQVAGKAAHESIDNQTYSTRRDVLQGYEIFCEKYNLCGKLDTFDIKSGRLTERKREIQKIYDGYVFQVYAQYFALCEMGYTVKEIVIYDITHNKNYPIPLPNDDAIMLKKFEQLVYDINHFDLDKKDFVPNEAKCKCCIYNNLCDYSLA
ncbi:MAG TPA: type V CRISPR-associated protein Cas4 [Turneriella sp.]|nr:type V CRISPR-associated protein Cas4 [Turneriella sp.]